MASDKPLRLLVMEDDPGQARLLQRVLQRAAYLVELAPDGETGLRLVEAGSYDLLLVDHQMPGTGGLEVLRTLATRGDPPPTILVTGHGDEAIAVEAMKLGAGDYLVKDVEGHYVTLLPTVIERVLAQRRVLAEKLQAEEALKQTLETLEARVVARTAELQQANAQLRAEMAERAQAERAMRESEARFRLLVQTAGSVIVAELETIVAQADRISRLMDRLLAFARAKGQPMAPLALPTVVAHALCLLEPRFRREAITVVVEMPADLPLVFGTADQLEQVFVNVLVNAWHAMPTGGTITIHVCTLDARQVQITVQDTGGGMSPQTLARACEPFYSTKGEQGTGLGLAICQQILDSHRGTMRLASTPGMGTTVTITLPRTEATGQG